ncbi:MAG: metallophosphoesterase [Candidatus Gastranaerophilales bacterium]|nr:metallophosphoesterase [Candidatus Gastranaerophilales bacterium]
MKKFILFIFALFIMQGCSYADVLEFAQISDVHYTIDNTSLDKYLYFLSLSLKKHDVDFAIFLGDNVDKSREEDVISFMRAIHSIKTPYYLVLGKNDAHKLSGIEKEVYMDIVSTFNRNQTEKNYYYFKPNSRFVCVVLDDTPDFAYSKHGEIPDEQIVWLDNLLTKYPQKLFLIFHHSPVIPPREEYKLSMLNTEKYTSMLKKHSNVILISSGHYHQEAIKEDERGVRHISAPAFMDIPHSYQIIKIYYDEKTYKSPKDVEVTVTKIKV